MKLVAINTIGLTGAEILCAELARHPEIRMLPGQNFIRFKNSIYRLHDYAGADAGAVFEMLALQHFTRSGKCWSGLTKSMSNDMREAYSHDAHKAHFIAGYKDASFKAVVSLFIESFYQSLGTDITDARYAGWFGNNIIVNSRGYPGLAGDVVFINFSNSLDYWLGNINQRFVWDNLVAIKFWIVNELFLRHFAKGRSNYMSIDILDCVTDAAGATRKLREFLQLPADIQPADAPPDGFIRLSTSLVNKIQRDATSLLPIYKDHAYYKLAKTIDDWSDAFLDDPVHTALLEKYAEFWNTSSHTNLDWIGPVEEEIVERALEMTGIKSARNLNCWFYHECFTLTSDHYQSPRSSLEHYLGCLEDDIVLPQLAYYARVAICYIESVADNCIRRPYSAVPIRETSLYKRLTHPDNARLFPLWAVTEKIAEMEAAIDKANGLMAEFYSASAEQPAELIAQ